MANSELLGGASMGSVGASGRRHLRKILASTPLQSEMDEGARASYETGFRSVIDEGRASAARLGVELRTLDGS